MVCEGDANPVCGERHFSVGMGKSPWQVKGARAALGERIQHLAMRQKKRTNGNRPAKGIEKSLAQVGGRKERCRSGVSLPL